MSDERRNGDNTCIRYNYCFYFNGVTMKRIKGVIMFYVCRKVRTIDGEKTEILDAPTGRWYYAGNDLGFTDKADAEKAKLRYVQANGVTGLFVKEIELEQEQAVRE